MRTTVPPIPPTRRPVTCPRTTAICVEPSSLLDAIGHTPMVRLRAASDETGCRILAKCEHMNPGGSVKDRIARAILQRAEERGALRPGMTILEVTSGNTGIALSMVGSMMGYAVRILLPRTVSEERRHMIRSFGAELELIDEVNRISAAVEDAHRRAASDPSLFLPSQFENPDNPWAHETTTGPEILVQTGARLDAFVMGVGTGGTVMGVGRALRSAGVRGADGRPTRVVAVEPDESAVMSGGAPGRHGIQGLADGFVPPIVQLAELDEIVRVRTDDAKSMAARLAREEGLLVGISSGANVLAATEIARRLGPGRTVVTMLCDRGERYLSVGANGAGAAGASGAAAANAASGACDASGGSSGSGPSGDRVPCPGCPGQPAP